MFVLPGADRVHMMATVMSKARRLCKQGGELSVTNPDVVRSQQEVKRINSTQEEKDKKKQSRNKAISCFSEL